MLTDEWSLDLNIGKDLGIFSSFIQFGIGVFL